MSSLTEAQKKAKAKYYGKVKRVLIEFYPADAALYERVQAQDNKQGYIKDLIKKDIN